MLFVVKIGALNNCLGIFSSFPLGVTGSDTTLSFNHLQSSQSELVLFETLKTPKTCWYLSILDLIVCLGVSSNLAIIGISCLPCVFHEK